MAEPTTTIRIRLADKRKLDRLCRTTKRGIIDMVSVLLDKERAATQPNGSARSRKVG